MIKNHFQLY